MSLREQEIAERRRIRRKHKQPSQAEAERRRQQRERARAAEHEHHRDAVLTFRVWCQLNNFSKATGRRIIARGEIAVLQLSPRRIGIKESENARWQSCREIAR
jgi:hypothetical protein